MSKVNVAMTVNGKAVSAEVEPRTLLIHYLREHLSLTGSHIGCDTSHCGACTVDLDGKSVKSCTVFASRRKAQACSPSKAWPAPTASCTRCRKLSVSITACNAAICTPGMILRAHRLLQENPNPSEAEIRYGISGNLCRCTGYQNIVTAIQHAAATLAGAAFKEAAE